MNIFARIFSFFILLNAYSFLIQAQDIHFSQFYASPLTLNPALTGSHSGDWSIMNNIRRQWAPVSPAFITTSLGYDRNFTHEENKYSAGGILVYDQSGDAKFTSTKFYVSGAYHLLLNEDQLSFGLQLGYVHKSIGAANLSFPDQYNNNTGLFDASLATSEVSYSQQFGNIDINTGVYWKKKIGNMTPEAGFGVFHVNQPSESFIDGNTNQDVRATIHFGNKIALNSKSFVYPRVQYMKQQKASSLVVGSSYGFILPVSSMVKTFHFGAYGRLGVSRNIDAVIPTVGALIYNFNVGVSYDVNISDLTTATKNRGGLEFSIIYRHITQLLEKSTVPCERM